MTIFTSSSSHVDRPTYRSWLFVLDSPDPETRSVYHGILESMPVTYRRVIKKEDKVYFYIYDKRGKSFSQVSRLLGHPTLSENATLSILQRPYTYLKRLVKETPCDIDISYGDRPRGQGHPLS